MDSQTGGSQGKVSRKISQGGWFGANRRLGDILGASQNISGHKPSPYGYFGATTDIVGTHRPLIPAKYWKGGWLGANRRLVNSYVASLSRVMV